MYFQRPAYTRNRTGRIQPDNSTITQGIQSLNFASLFQFIEQERMKAMKTLRNIIGTVGLLYAGYVIIASMKDVRRYIRISSM